jgi:hypothetical protein
LTATGSWKPAAAVAGRLTAFNPFLGGFGCGARQWLAGCEDLDADVGEILVLRPDGQAESERERDGWPVVGVAGSDPLLRLIAVRLVVGFQDPLDRHRLQRSKQQRRTKYAAVPALYADRA